VRSKAIEKTLNELADLLESVGEAHIAESPRRLATQIGSAIGDEAYQKTVRKVMRLFGGMGSFQDLVLQTSEGVRREHAELERLRDRLFEEVKRELR
jgi:hypothetical protein